jgi:FdhD protein
MEQEATVITRNGHRSSATGELPREFPLRLTVNGVELATLIASPHDLRFLVAGFLRMQGYVGSVDDFELLSVCEDYGIASVRIRGELPERSAPVLTSGCGAGISFRLPSAPSGKLPAGSCGTVSAGTLFSLFEELARHAQRYRRHGGIHSAAVGDAGGILLHAEDLGRHNAIDRLAGEALLKGIDISGKVLITSGRISSEMAAKAALLGVSVVASRTSPTDMAVTICEQAGISVVGYLKGDRFTVYAHPEIISQPKIIGVTGVILAGGASSRMGKNKALLEIGGEPLIGRIYRTLSELFEEVVVVAPDPEQYAFLGCLTVTDIWQGKGTMVGVHAGLSACRGNAAFVVGCDMPFLQCGFIRYLAEIDTDADVVVPRSPDGLHPLHAIYRNSALPVMERFLREGNLSMMDFLAALRTRVVEPEEFARFDARYSSVVNVNTPQEFETACNSAKTRGVDEYTS